MQAGKTPIYSKFEPLSIKSHPALDERWVQQLTADDLDLGDLVLKDKDRIQLLAGRLDLVLQGLESGF